MPESLLPFGRIYWRIWQRLLEEYELGALLGAPELFDELEALDEYIGGE